MGDLFAGGGLNAFARNAAAIVEDTTGAFHNGLYCPYAINVPKYYNLMDSAPFHGGAVDELWFRMDWFPNCRTFGGLDLFSMIDSGANPLFKLSNATGNGNTVVGRYWNGSAFVNVGAPYSVPYQQLLEVNFHIKGGTGGIFEAWIGDINMVSQSMSMALLTGMNRLRMGNLSDGAVLGGSDYYSRVVVSTDSTRNLIPIEVPVTAAGTNADWTGAYTDVNEVPLDDGTMISSSTAAQKFDYAKAAITVPTGYRIRSFVPGYRIRRQLTGPQDCYSMLRSAGTDYTGALLAPDPGLDARVDVYTTDPATGVRFTQAGFNAMTYGGDSHA